MLEARNIWDLVVRRAEETPDREMAVDERGRAPDLRRVPRAGRAGRGRPGRPRACGDGDVVSGCMPTTAGGDGALRRPAPPRARCRTRSCPSTASARSASSSARPGRRLLIVPSEWRGFDYEAMAAAVTDGRPAPRCWWSTRTLPEGDPATLPPAADDDDDGRRRRAGAVHLLHLGHHGRAQGRPPRRPHPARRRRWACPSGWARRGRPLRLRVPDHPRRPGASTSTRRWPTGSRSSSTRRSTPPPRSTCCGGRSVTQAGAGTFFHQTYLAAQRALPEGERLFPHVRAFPGGGAPKPPQPPPRAQGGVRRRRGVGLRADRGADPHDEPPTTTSTTCWPPPRARRSPAPGCARHASTARRPGVGEEGEVRAKGAPGDARLPRRLARRRRVRRGRLVPHGRPRRPRRRRATSRSPAG